MSSKKQDVRKNARVPIHAKAFISFGGSMQIGSVLDLSTGGVSVKMRGKIPLGSQVEVLVEKDHVTAAFVGRVLRETAHGLVLQVRSQTNPLSKMILAL